MRIRGVETKFASSNKTEQQSKHFKNDEDFFNQMKADAESLEVGKLPGMNVLDSRSRKQRRAAEREQEQRQKKTINTKEPQPTEEGVEFSSQIPPIIFIANKCEDGFEGDVLSDFYSKFPEVAEQIDPLTNK